MPTALNSDASQATIVDLSHHNGVVDLTQARQAGILGIIQKATQSATFVDPTFQTNFDQARNAGLLLGAYHFGAGDDGVILLEYSAARCADFTDSRF